MSLYTFLRSLRPEYQAIELEKLIVPRCKSVLDVGCGQNSNLSFFKNKITYSVGIDIHKGDLEKSKKRKIHSKYILDDALNIDKHFKPGSFDCVMAIGLIEHMEKRKALLLIKKMETIAKKIVIIGTPNGFLHQDEYGGNPYQVHKSGFRPKDFFEKGYGVIGMDGPKFLRDENASLKFKPVIFFAVLANILDPLLRLFPQWTLNLIAYKKLNK